MITSDATRIGDELLERWATFVTALTEPDVFEVIGTEDVVTALIDRSLLQREIEQLDGRVKADFAERLIRSDEVFRAAAPLVLERTQIALFKDDEPATDWWWRLEELVLEREGETLHNVPDSAEIKGVHPHTIRAAIKEGSLPARRLARGFLIRRRDLERWQPKRVGRPARKPQGDALLEAFNLANTGGDFERAHRLATTIEHDPSTPRRCLALALDAYNRHDYEKAEVWGRRSLAGDLPDTSRQVALLVLGRGLLNLDRPRECVALLEDATGLGPVDGLVRASLADAYLALGRASQAVANAQIAVDEAPDVPEMRYVLARMEWHADRPWDALEHLIEYRAHRPLDIDAMLLQCSAFGLIADRTGESGLYRRALALADRANESPNIDALRLRGQTLCRLGKWRAALGDARRILRLDEPVEDRTVAAEQLVNEALDAAVQGKRGDLESALKIATRLVGSNVEITRRRAIASASTGDVAGTLATLDTTAETVAEADAGVRSIAAIAYAVSEQPKRALDLLADITEESSDLPTLLLMTQTALASNELRRAELYLRAIASQPGLAGEVAETAFKLLHARAEADMQSATFASLASGFAAANRHDVTSPAPINASSVASPWEGRHPIVTPVLDRLASALVH